MKHAFSINGNIFDVSKISAVYVTATDLTDGDYNTIYNVRVVVDGVDIVVFAGIGIDARGVRDKIANVLTTNAEIIKI
jgi:hypothetical protein